MLVGKQLLIRKNERVLSKKRSSFRKFVFFCGKEGTFNTVVSSKEISLPEFELDREWEYSENCNRLILVKNRFEQNKNSRKNELKPSDFVQNTIGNGYIQPFYQVPLFMQQIINLV